MENSVVLTTWEPGWWRTSCLRGGRKLDERIPLQVSRNKPLSASYSRGVSHLQKSSRTFSQLLLERSYRPLWLHHVGQGPQSFTGLAAGVLLSSETATQAFSAVIAIQRLPSPRIGVPHWSHWRMCPYRATIAAWEIAWTEASTMLLCYSRKGYRVGIL